MKRPSSPFASPPPPPSRSRDGRRCGGVEGRALEPLEAAGATTGEARHAPMPDGEVFRPAALGSLHGDVSRGAAAEAAVVVDLDEDHCCFNSVGPVEFISDEEDAELDAGDAPWSFSARPPVPAAAVPALAAAAAAGGRPSDGRAESDSDRSAARPKSIQEVLEDLNGPEDDTCPRFLESWSASRLLAEKLRAVDDDIEARLGSSTPSSAMGSQASLGRSTSSLLSSASQSQLSVIGERDGPPEETEDRPNFVPDLDVQPTPSLGSSAQEKLGALLRKRQLSQSQRDAVSAVQLQDEAFQTRMEGGPQQREVYGSASYECIRHFGDIDCVERVVIKASTGEEACKIAAELLVGAARRISIQKDAVFVRLKAGVNSGWDEAVAELLQPRSGRAVALRDNPLPSFARSRGSDWEVWRHRFAVARTAPDSTSRLRQLSHQVKQLKWTLKDILRKPGPAQVPALQREGVTLAQALARSERVMLDALVFVGGGFLQVSNKIAFEWRPLGSGSASSALPSEELEPISEMHRPEVDMLDNLLRQAKIYVEERPMKAAKRLWSLFVVVAATAEPGTSAPAGLRDEAVGSLGLLEQVFQGNGAKAAQLATKLSALLGVPVDAPVVLARRADEHLQNFRRSLDTLRLEVPSHAGCVRGCQDLLGDALWGGEVRRAELAKLRGELDRLAKVLLDEGDVHIKHLVEAAERLLRMIPAGSPLRRPPREWPASQSDSEEQRWSGSCQAAFRREARLWRWRMGFASPAGC
mmetsp:Transcript_81246/g.263421  ORF Transcript_81246/g.263421 Transcript_81246/m.263421 type:complete len:755 (+) Transcript_81246:2-2266(+)